MAPLAAPVRSVQRLVAVFRYWRRKRMYIASWGRPSPGIDPRMPTVFGWSEGLHTSIVDHSSRDCISERPRASSPVVAEADPVSRQAPTNAASAPRHGYAALELANSVKIAPAGAGGAGSAWLAGERVDPAYLARAPRPRPSRLRRVISLGNGWHAFTGGGGATRTRAGVLDAGRKRPRADRRVRRPAPVRGGRGGLPRG